MWNCLTLPTHSHPTHPPHLDPLTSPPRAQLRVAPPPTSLAFSGCFKAHLQSCEPSQAGPASFRRLAGSAPSPEQCGGARGEHETLEPAVEFWVLLPGSVHAELLFLAGKWQGSLSGSCEWCEGLVGLGKGALRALTPMVPPPLGASPYPPCLWSNAEAPPHLLNSRYWEKASWPLPF